MAAMTPAHRAAIERVVSPERARFDRTAREALSTDRGVRPVSVWPLGGRTVADGIVWPRTEQEIVQLVRLARAEGIPLVQRGGGTAAAGGAVPAKGGLVLDLSLLSGLSEVAAAAHTPDGAAIVTVHAGTRWTELAVALQAHGLASRTYPTSAPLATVGGWLAQGGAGVGSFAFGWMDENVAGVRIVDGRGHVYSLHGRELAGISEAEGTTGIITEVQLEVRPLTATWPMAIAFHEVEQLVEAVRQATERELPIWTASFVDPDAARWLNIARPSSEPLPEAYVASLACATADGAIVERQLRQVSDACGGEWLPAPFAQRQWRARFVPLRILRPGAESAPADVVVPTESLAAMLAELGRNVADALGVEGTFVRGGYTVMHAYLAPGTADARQAYGLGFALDAVDLAVRYGGRGQTTGRYFGPQAKTILGAQRIELMREMRGWLDPAGILNPGKVVFDNAALGQMVRLSARGNPLRHFIRH